MEKVMDTVKWRFYWYNSICYQDLSKALDAWSNDHKKKAKKLMPEILDLVKGKLNKKKKKELYELTGINVEDHKILIMAEEP